MTKTIAIALSNITHIQKSNSSNTQMLRGTFKLIPSALVEDLLPISHWRLSLFTKNSNIFQYYQNLRNTWMEILWASACGTICLLQNWGLHHPQRLASEEQYIVCLRWLTNQWISQFLLTPPWVGAGVLAACLTMGNCDITTLEGKRSWVSWVVPGQTWPGNSKV